MSQFGRYGTVFPIRFGGGPSVLEQEHMAMLDALAPAWDVSESTEVFAETYGLALAVTAVWAMNRRLEGSRVPARMLETLTTWETACDLRPLPGSSPLARRRAIAAKLRGFVGNQLSAIEDVCSELGGSFYLGIALASDYYSYLAGLNPGPPGFEWTSNRAHLAVRLEATAGATDAVFLAVVQALQNALHALVPAWLTFAVGTDEDGFTADMGTVEQTLLDDA